MGKVVLIGFALLALLALGLSQASYFIGMLDILGMFAAVHHVGLWVTFAALCVDIMIGIIAIANEWKCLPPHHHGDAV